jgi:hypothetical protein
VCQQIALSQKRSCARAGCHKFIFLVATLPFPLRHSDVILGASSSLRRMLFVVLVSEYVNARLSVSSHFRSGSWSPRPLPRYIFRWYPLSDTASRPNDFIIIGQHEGRETFGRSCFSRSLLSWPFRTSPRIITNPTTPYSTNHEVCLEINAAPLNSSLTILYYNKCTRTNNANAHNAVLLASDILAIEISEAYLPPRSPRASRSYTYLIRRDTPRCPAEHSLSSYRSHPLCGSNSACRAYCKHSAPRESDKPDKERIWGDGVASLPFVGKMVKDRREGKHHV